MKSCLRSALNNLLDIDAIILSFICSWELKKRDNIIAEYPSTGPKNQFIEKDTVNLLNFTRLALCLQTQLRPLSYMHIHEEFIEKLPV
jgi:hypothetical protein